MRRASPSCSLGRPSSPSGRRAATRSAILQGVEQGDTIVTAGQIKLHNGSVVMIDNSVDADGRGSPGPASTS